MKLREFNLNVGLRSVIDAAIEPSLDLHRRLTQVTISSNLSTKKMKKIETFFS
jgi:hypothetical protein